MIEWREEFSFGIEKIDNQHKEFLRRLNDFLAALKGGKGKEEILRVFEFLEGYVVFHFEDEENFMKEMGFSDVEKHVKVHKEFREKVSGLKETLEKEGPSLSFILKISKELTDWYINHIGKMDKKYAQAFKEKS